MQVQFYMTGKEMQDSDFEALNDPSPTSKSDAPASACEAFSSTQGGGRLSVGRRPLFLRALFNDCYHHFPSIKDMPFIYKGFAEDHGRQYFFIDVYDKRGRPTHQGFIASHQEIFSYEGEK